MFTIHSYSDTLQIFITVFEKRKKVLSEITTLAQLSLKFKQTEKNVTHGEKKELILVKKKFGFIISSQKILSSKVSSLMWNKKNDKNSFLIKIQSLPK